MERGDGTQREGGRPETEPLARGEDRCLPRASWLQ